MLMLHFLTAVCWTIYENSSLTAAGSAALISGSKTLLQGRRGQCADATKGDFLVAMPDSLRSQEKRQAKTTAREVLWYG